MNLYFHNKLQIFIYFAYDTIEIIGKFGYRKEQTPITCLIGKHNNNGSEKGF